MSKEPTHQELPAGLALQRTLAGHAGVINRIAWSPDGEMLASASEDRTIHLWDSETGQVRHQLSGHADWVYSVAWSPDSKRLASGGADSRVLIWSAETGQQLTQLPGHTEGVFTVAWSPDGRLVASGAMSSSILIWDVETKAMRELPNRQFWVNSVSWSPDGSLLAAGLGSGSIELWDTKTWALRRTLGRHAFYVVSIAWSPDGRTLASASYDSTIGIWNTETNQKERILEGHADYVKCVAFSPDSKFLASKGNDDTVRLWRCDTWQIAASLREPSPSIRFDQFYSPTSELLRGWPSGLAFHPRSLRLATLGKFDRVVRIWQLRRAALLGAVTEAQYHYCNAKVVLVGDTGVGKSCLGLSLSGKPFTPMESTHSRHVWTLERQDVELTGDILETRETLLWDLAGQPGYRLIHQLHLDEVDVALVVFDSRSETEPFAGVYHWSRALRQADQRREGSAAPITKFLVAARADRGGISVSRERIDSLLQDLGFAGYFETSAKEGWQVEDLARAIREAIDWEKRPRVSSTELFRKIRSFLLAEKEAGRVLSTTDDLYRSFVGRAEILVDAASLRAQFAAYTGRLEAQGLVRRLSFADLVLLQPELLDAYAAMLISAAQREPDGLGSIAEEDARDGRFPILQGERIPNRELEKLLLIATIEDLLRHDIALREQAQDGPLLVFPSQLTRESRELPAPQGKWVTFSFEGSVPSIYTTLVVRLSHSEIFTCKEMWKSAAEFTSLFGATFGILLNGQVEDGSGDLSLFADSRSSQEMRQQFEEYVLSHLLRRSLPGSVKRRCLFGCTACGTPLAQEAVAKLRQSGREEVPCYFCGQPVSLLDHGSGSAANRSGAVLAMDRAADLERDRAAAMSVLQGKLATQAFDVFLCHNKDDKALVRQIGEQLKTRGILPWLDEWELRPGLPWQEIIEEQIDRIRCAAVFVGQGGLGPWQTLEQSSFLRQFVERKCPVIPVILPTCTEDPKLPVFLKGMTWVDLRQGGEELIDQLIWGITGDRRSQVVLANSP